MTLIVILFSFISSFLLKKFRLSSLTIAFLFYGISLFLLNSNVIKLIQLNFYNKFLLLSYYFVLLIGAFVGTNIKYKKVSVSAFKINIEKKVFFYSITIAAISIILNTFYQLKLTDGFLGFFMRYNELYSERIDGTQHLLIPYLNSIIYISACAGGGILGFSNKESKLIYGMLPIILILIDSILNFGRANLLIGFLIFITSYFYSYYRKNNYKIKLKTVSLIKIITILAVLLFLMTQIRKFRGGLENYTINSDNILIEKLIDWGLISPSVFIYVAGPPSVFNQSIESGLLSSDDIMIENTFAPIARIYAPLFMKEVKRYEEFVNIGPRYSNSGTMFKDFILDFGLFGTVIFTFFLGYFYGLSYGNYLNTGDLYLYSFLSTYIIMGTFVNLFRSGQFLIPFLIVISITIFKKLRWKQPY